MLSCARWYDNSNERKREKKLVIKINVPARYYLCPVEIAGERKEGRKGGREGRSVGR